MLINTLFTIFIAYLIGSLSFALILTKIYKKDDPRLYGSGNAGATNVLRSGNKILAIFTLLGDILKGYLTIIFLSYLEFPLYPWTIYMVSIFLLIGHLWPIFFQFKGGKGVSTLFGIILAFSYQTALVCLLIWLIMIFLTKISSLSSIVVCFLSPILIYFFNKDYYLALTLTLMAIIVIQKHYKNIHNLLHHKEYQFMNNKKE